MGLFFRSHCYLSTALTLSGLLFIAESGTPANAAGSAYAWANCYAGAQAGYSASKANWNYTNGNPYTANGNGAPQTVAGAKFADDNGVIGLQGGCNRATSDSWLVGLEASWMSNPMRRDTSNNYFPPGAQDPAFNYQQTVTTNIQSVFGINGRLGYAINPDWLIYAKGGYALGEIRTSGRVSPDLFPPAFNFNTSNWQSGWTAGGGAEYRLFNNVTVGAEYSYYDFGSARHSGKTNVFDTGVPADPVNHRVSADMHTVMARINFGFGGDPSAAYAQQNSSPLYVKAPPASPVASAFSAFTNSEVKYSSWNGTRGSNIFAPDRGGGYQVYSPMTIGINYEMPSELKFETRVKGGYVYSAHTTPNQKGYYDGPIDTQVSFNATFLNFDMIRPLLGVSMNLPTGNSFLPGNQRFTRMDPDLVDVGSYGVGFNINPTAGFIIGLNETTALSVSAGYAWQGEFTKEGVSLGLTPANDQLNFSDLRRKIDPGDTFTANANITTSVSDNLVLLGSFAFMSEAEVKTDGVASGRSGSRYTSNLTANYKIDDRWAISTNASWSFAEKNKITSLFGALIAEPKNSNSNVLIGSFEPTYQMTERLRLGLNYSVLYRDENFYDPIEDQFVPAKLKQSVGMSAAYVISPAASISVRGSHAWIEQHTGAFLVTTMPPPVLANVPPSLYYEVWQATVAASMRF